MVRAVEASLRRLKTDYIDLFFLHTWDRITPVEEVMRTFDDLVSAGKIRYAGLSDVPAWYAARAQTWAEAHGLSQPIALQLPYSLVDRGIELEYVQLAQTLGLGITAWSPLAMGLLSGKYRAGEQVGRLAQDKTGTGLGYFTGRNNRILDVLERCARDVGRSMAQVSLNWVVNRAGVAAAVIGATKIEQLQDNLGALNFTLPAEWRIALDEASELNLPHPYTLFEPDYQAGILNAGTSVGDKPENYFAPTFIPEVTSYQFGKPKSK